MLTVRTNRVQGLTGFGNPLTKSLNLKGPLVYDVFVFVIQLPYPLGGGVSHTTDAKAGVTKVVGLNAYEHKIYNLVTLTHAAGP